MSEGDDTDLLDSCRQLEAELSSVRELKLAAQIDAYQRQCEVEYLLDVEASNKHIEKEYNGRRAQLKARYEQNLGRCARNREQIAKQMAVYSHILEQLRARRHAVEEEYAQQVGKLAAVRDRCTAEWKKNSNENIKKFSCPGLQGRTSSSTSRKRESFSIKSEKQSKDQ